jgi:hypothetical protein
MVNLCALRQPQAAREPARANSNSARLPTGVRRSRSSRRQPAGWRARGGDFRRLSGKRPSRRCVSAEAQLAEVMAPETKRSNSDRRHLGPSPATRGRWTHSGDRALEVTDQHHVHGTWATSGRGHARFRRGNVDYQVLEGFRKNMKPPSTPP